MKTIQERFWSKVQKTDTCWLWTGATGGNGYGHLRSEDMSSMVYAHRLSWEWANGPIPEGFKVLHKCDVPQCVRPDHLFLGTQDGNMKDMASKARSCLGSKNRRSKLSEGNVIEIRRLHLEGMSYSQIAKRFGVTLATIGFVVQRVTWKHVA